MIGWLAWLGTAPAAAVDVEVRHDGVFVVYRLEAGERIEDVWAAVPPRSGGPRSRARWPDVHVWVEAVESDGGLLVTVDVEERVAGEVVDHTRPTLVITEEAPRAYFLVGAELPLARQVDARTVHLRYVHVPRTEVSVFPEGERGDDVVEAD